MTKFLYGYERKAKTQFNMTPTIIFGDVHGSTYWKEVVSEYPDRRYIFLGDYLDPYEAIENNVLIDNLKEIIQLKKERPDDVVLLLGNHDMHYVDWDFEPCSRYNVGIEMKIHVLFTENRSLFTYAFQEGNRIFTHAGISQKWFFEDFGGDIEKNIAEQFNNPRPEQIPALYRCGWFRGGGWFRDDNKRDIGGIFWADINELEMPLQGFVQFVGHNKVDKIRKYVVENGMIFFCDCLYNKEFLKLDFENVNIK